MPPWKSCDATESSGERGRVSLVTEPAAEPTDFDWRVRTAVFSAFAQTGRAPAIPAIAAQAGATEHQIHESLERLQSAHQLALLPDGNVWMANPFSAVPTAYPVETTEMTCWANCAWDALGVLALLEVDGRIQARCAESGEPLDLRVEGGELCGGAGVIHLVTPIREAWTDIGFT
jgi:hypothetical protein